MVKKLRDIATGKLLEKFGAGNHKPGSGSASALQGMLSAQLLRTVIDLTIDPKHRNAYLQHINELLRIKNEIDSRIYIALERLFQEDSDEFDKVIKIRERRDKELDPLKKRKLSEEAQSALKIATEIPLKIAELCEDLGEFSIYVFDYGFKSARGDTGVALHSAISAMASCLCIIELNLISLPLNSSIEAIRQQKTNVKSRYESLSLSSIDKLKVLEKESTEAKAYLESIAVFQAGNLADSVHSISDIEEIVRRLQNTLWLQRDKIWKNESIENPIKVLKPDVVLKKVMGYTCIISDTLGKYQQSGEIFEIAGLINKNKKLIQASKSFPQETQNFTLAHELGHAILHKQVILHRDRPIDGSMPGPKSIEEIQVDKFASYFLMPSNLVEDVFFEIFEAPKFVINEATVLAIGGKSVLILKRECQNIRGLTRMLSSTSYYAGKVFNPLAKIFNVSTETMAIRLEELELVEF
jgi:formiminotetrahydrofolate cyclodeaminase/Zn-dependent peptidase ImmA (M78 family)